MSVQKLLSGFAALAPVGASAAATTSETKALSQYLVDSWRTEQGLPMDLVHVVLQTQDGYLWL